MYDQPWSCNLLISLEREKQKGYDFLDLVSKKYLIWERKENNFVNEILHEDGITTIYRIFSCTKPCAKYFMNILVFSLTILKEYCFSSEKILAQRSTGRSNS